MGSTTTKLAAWDPVSGRVVWSDYRRHGAAQLDSIKRALKRFAEHFPGARIRVAMTGSGAKPCADLLGLPFTQEVVANAIALKAVLGLVGTAVELGGQDAKMLFFRPGEKDGSALKVDDMRMNGSCAGGTGAFLDEVASILKLQPEELNGMAAEGHSVYHISGRCGVFAKTDIQPLLNQGAAREDLALSAFHAIAKQTLGGLAQGLDIRKPVAFLGGPLHFNPVLVRVFQERLGLSPGETLIPEHPEIMAALGAALSLPELFPEEERVMSAEALSEELERRKGQIGTGSAAGQLYFETEEEKEAFLLLHRKPDLVRPPEDTARSVPGGRTIRAYLGIDSGSTTTKFVLIGEDEQILYSFYAPNGGAPLDVAKKALLSLRKQYEDAGITLEILAAGSTGYGEMLFHKAFSTESHVVETVAHARAAGKYVKDATFLLDIGGQDMKAIWLDHGVITNIVVNEACSSGCGSFLQNFAAALHIPVERIAEEAFASQNPANLGSRCTVFMNSSIITEQRNGRLPGDIMAGLCRSIIENVFTKVIRVSNLSSLGDRIVVQGGTFENDAVLRAMEQYVGHEVTRAPYPGLMGAIGAALVTKEEAEQRGRKKAAQTFIGLSALEDLSWTQNANSPCPFCGNHCRRTIVRFSNGNTWVMNNRCERGEVLGDPRDERVRAEVLRREKEKDAVPNLYALREELLFREYQSLTPKKNRNQTIGIPRVLAFWDNMPFWTTFFRSLGFRVRISPKSTRKMYEDGLQAVTSDTVCFPAKLVHGHLRALAKMGVDRIFMPSVTVVPSENMEPHSESMCAVVKGYPIVVRNSDDPSRRFGIPFDAPLFHWYTDRDREKQLTEFMRRVYRIPPGEVKDAIIAGDRAEQKFRGRLKKAGAEVLKQAAENGTFAVVLASRPYQNDALVNHDLPEMFTQLKIPVLTADSLPDTEKTDLSGTRIDVVNNFHARMLSSAVRAALNDNLEYVQLVSFGCGHDAYLSDEIVRIMKELSGKTPLVLKLDESDVRGPLQIRVRSFAETVRRKRSAGTVPKVRPHLPDPYPVKFRKEDAEERVVLVPNTSHAFSRVMAAALKSQGIRAVSLPVGREEAIRLGKRYVHNDICFPAQIVIGEALSALRSGAYDPDRTAVIMGKYLGDCRLTHYGALLRKALDDAGFAKVPILTNDTEDEKDLHPGFRMNLKTASQIAFALPMIDIIEELLRKMRPYELHPGGADIAAERALNALVHGMETGGIPGMRRGFRRAIEIMKTVEYDRSVPKPTVLIVGEYLLNFHPGANREIERYLEKNGMEVIEARMTDVIRKTYFYKDAQIREYGVKKPVKELMMLRAVNEIFREAHREADRIASDHPLYRKPPRMEELIKDSDPVIHHTFDAGEGVLIPGEILHHAEEGCRNFLILQPFGCLPNHIVGRGIAKRLRELCPDIQVLALDYDPDISEANIENRLQMLIMNAKRK